MYNRLLNLPEKLHFFLFGARSTGKTALLRMTQHLKDAIWVDLLDDEHFLTFTRRPKQLEELLGERLARKNVPDCQWIVIDEIQRVPKLLNEVHRLIESNEYHGRVRFAMTGSSARKLKRKGANLLGGRAALCHLFPLSVEELGGDFDLSRALNWGTLPGVYTAEDDESRALLLKSYVGTFLREEIREEQIVRQLDSFSRFLEVAAQSSGAILNYSSIGRDCRLDPNAVSRYFQVLEDTLLGFTLPAYSRSVRKQQNQAPKFYLFDLGVQRALSETLSVPVVPKSYGYGRVFEQFVVLEIHKMNHYLRRDLRLSYLRTKDGAEIDLIVEDACGNIRLVEIKSSSQVPDEDAAKLERFLPSFPGSEAVILSQDAIPRLVGKVRVLPWREGVRELFMTSSADRGHELH